MTILSFGGPKVLTVADLPVPEPGRGEVRIRVQAAAIHPLDIVARSGFLGPMLPLGPRYVLGADVAGVVDAIGPSVTDFSIGQSVVGMSNWPDTKVGTQAEYVVLPTEVLASAPMAVEPAPAATLPLNALTARQALDILDLSAGQTLAVTGAAGGVGGFAVELARHRGLKVIGVAGPQDEEFLTGLGADFVERSEDPGAAIRKAARAGVDGVLDSAAIGAVVLAGVRDGGAYVGVTPPSPPESVRGIRTGVVLARGLRSQLTELVELVEQGRITLRAPRTYPIESVAEAHTTLAKGGVRGGVVLIP
ncbi:NADPH:quinone reductase-like Zn-dependent oxidoreductase [Nocardiopsis mwathae]|uniref:NADPH:quinone reductase-like Zn-dependent oxidoreductase n=1 Tax=Nocardiopsis mwathae TaxID=1472723 RepID=A0A7X0D752_9ACTN|nr:NADPH:quinone reductase-like Zn-dependent oxidoreductase [Nocardiopsis mwathae]